MEPGTRPSTARQALPERSSLAGPSRSGSAARLTLAGAHGPAGNERPPPGPNGRAAVAGGGLDRVLGHARGNWHPAHRRPAGRPTEAPWSSVGATLADHWPSRCDPADLAGGCRPSCRPRPARPSPRLVIGAYAPLESPGPTRDACSDAKSAFAKTSTARPWGGTQEPAGPQPGRFFALAARRRAARVNAGVVPATGSTRSSPR